MENQIYYHVATNAEHARDFQQFRVGHEYAVGFSVNPFTKIIENSATRDLPMGEVMRGYKAMLRESVFENIRLSNYPNLPSRRSCLWMASSLEGACAWMSRLPHRGNKRVLEIRVLGDGVVHMANEGHLTTGPLNIQELELHAHNYWSGKTADGMAEFLYAGRFRVIREVR